MTAGPAHAPPDPLATLREYRALAPWGLRDLAALAGGILDASGRGAGERGGAGAAERAHIRFYVARGLVSPPDGRGTAAVYSYRHLLQVLAIKLRQMEGATLETMTREFAGLTGDLIERRVAGVARARAAAARTACRSCRRPAPAAAGWGGRCSAGSRPVEGAGGAARPAGASPSRPGIEVLIDEQHPVLRLNGDTAAIAEALRQALARTRSTGP